MTDITELAQREKFEAWLSEKPLHARYMHWSNTLNAYDYTGIQLAWQAYQAGGAELVEALEKAQQQITQLESRTVKLPKLKMLEDYLAEVAIEERKQILVGVKLEFHRACAAAGIKVEAE